MLQLEKKFNNNYVCMLIGFLYIDSKTVKVRFNYLSGYQMASILQNHYQLESVQIKIDSLNNIEDGCKIANDETTSKLLKKEKEE